MTTAHTKSLPLAIGLLADGKPSSIVLATLALVMIGTLACGDGGSTSPTQPTPTPSPTPTRTPTDISCRSVAVVNGVITLDVGEMVTVSCQVEYSDNSTADLPASATWESEDTSVATVTPGSITGVAPGNTALVVRLDTVTARFRITVVAAPPPPGPRTSFGPGTWLVNEEIRPGRYYTNPSRGCYWARLSGTSGSTDIIANEFLGFDAGQEIVFIRETDHGFETQSNCHTWRRSTTITVPAGTIPPGRWLVGRQIQPGQYETDARDGCYWERLRGFSGESRDRITNDFVSGGGRQLVTIRSSDVGFFTDAACGTWRRR